MDYNTKNFLKEGLNPIGADLPRCAGQLEHGA